MMHRYIKLGIVLLVLLGIVAGALLVFNPNKGTLAFTLSPSDATLTIDGKTVKGSSFKLSSGKHTVAASKDGYLTQSTSVTISKGKTVTSGFTLKTKTTSNIVYTVVGTAFHAKYPSYPLTVLAAKELYNGAWIVARTKSNSDPAVVVLKQNIANSSYDIYLGPGTSFDPDVVATLPADVQSTIKALQ